MQECKEKCSEICGNQKFPPKQKSMMPVIQLILTAQPNAKLVKKLKIRKEKSLNASSCTCTRLPPEVKALTLKNPQGEMG